MTNRASDAVAAAYDAWAASYDEDENRTRDLDAATLRTLLADAAFDRIVEAGCGTGKNTGWLAARCRALLALDLSRGMLAVARRKVAATNVAFVQADLTSAWPLRAAGADLVAFDLVLEHVRDLDPVFAAATTALRPGGELLAIELHPFRQYEGKQAHFRVGEAVTMVPAHRHHVSDFVRAAQRAGLELVDLREWWHQDDAGRPPRLLSLRWRRPG